MQPWWKSIKKKSYWPQILNAHCTLYILLHSCSCTLLNIVLCMLHSCAYNIIHHPCLVPVKPLFHSKMIQSSTCFCSKHFLAEISCYASREYFEFSRMHQDTLVFTLQMRCVSLTTSKGALRDQITKRSIEPCLQLYLSRCWYQV